MENVNTWLAALVAVFSVLAGMAAMLRAVVNTLDSRIDARIATHLGPTNDRIDATDARIEEQGRSLSERIDALSARMDAFDTKLDHVAEVVDLRLKPLEEDMALVKRHLLGSPAA
jgi:hypothetical protein